MTVDMVISMMMKMMVIIIGICIVDTVVYYVDNNWEFYLFFIYIDFHLMNKETRNLLLVWYALPYNYRHHKHHQNIIISIIIIIIMIITIIVIIIIHTIIILIFYRSIFIRCWAYLFIQGKVFKNCVISISMASSFYLKMMRWTHKFRS